MEQVFIVGIILTVVAIMYATYLRNKRLAAKRALPFALRVVCGYLPGDYTVEYRYQGEWKAVKHCRPFSSTNDTFKDSIGFKDIKEAAAFAKTLCSITDVQMHETEQYLIWKQECAEWEAQRAERRKNWLDVTIDIEPCKVEESK